VTSVSTARAIKAIATSGDDRSGVRDALVDIWGRCEAARSLWIDTLLAEKQGTDYDERVADLWETARLTAPEAIATALRLGEPVNGYVEFTSRILGGR
jgi:hypothetical protein